MQTVFWSPLCGTLFWRRRVSRSVCPSLFWRWLCAGALSWRSLVWRPLCASALFSPRVSRTLFSPRLFSRASLCARSLFSPQRLFWPLCAPALFSPKRFSWRRLSATRTPLYARPVFSRRQLSTVSLLFSRRRSLFSSAAA